MLLDLHEVLQQISEAIGKMGGSMIMACDKPQDPDEFRVWVFFPLLDTEQARLAAAFVKTLIDSNKLFPERLDDDVSTNLVGMIWLCMGHPPKAFAVLEHPQMEAFRAMTSSIFGDPSETDTFTASRGNAMLTGDGPDPSDLN